MRKAHVSKQHYFRPTYNVKSSDSAMTSSLKFGFYL